MFYTWGMEYTGELLVDPHPDPDVTALDPLPQDVLPQDVLPQDVLDAWFAGLEAEPDALVPIAEPDAFETDASEVVPTPLGSPVAAIDVVGFAIQDAAAAQFEANRAMAAHVAALAMVVDVARRNPHVYLTEGGLTERDAVELAERAAS